MDEHLMRPPRFQATLDQRVFAETFQGADVRDGALSLACRAAAATAVARIARQPGLDRAVHGMTAHDGQVVSLGRVRAELLAEVSLGLGGASEDEQPTCFLV